MKRQLTAVVEWWKATRLAKSLDRFGANGGSVLTGGIAYAALFSVFSALALVYTALMTVFGRNETLRDSVMNAIGSALPGIVDPGDGTGLIRPDELRFTPGLGVAGVVATVILVMTAISAVGALRVGVRQMFTAPGSETAEGEILATDNPIVAKLRTLAGFVGIGFGIVLSAAVSVAATGLADDLFPGLTAAVGPWPVGVVGVLAGAAVDMVTFVFIVKVVASIDIPVRQIWSGAAIAGVALSTVRVLGVGVVAGSAANNPLLASVAAVATLLVWINFIARIILTSAAWTAQGAWDDRDVAAPADPSADDEDAAATTARPARSRVVPAYLAGAGTAWALRSIRDRRRRD